MMAYRRTFENARGVPVAELRACIRVGTQVREVDLLDADFFRVVIASPTSPSGWRWAADFNDMGNAYQFAEQEARRLEHY